MSSSLRRGAVAATVIALSTLSLGACGAGFDAQTNGVRPDNASATVDDIKVQNVNIVTTQNGDGPASVTARIFNDGTKDERLTGVTVKGASDVELAPAENGELVVPAGGSLVLGGEDNASATLVDSEGVTKGDAQVLTFELSDTGNVELNATVVPDTRQYADWGPTPASSPTEDTEQRPEDPSATDEPEAGEGEATDEETGQPTEDAGEQAPEESPAS